MMKKQSITKVLLIALALVASLGLIVACGGSSGGGTSKTHLSGTVASGAPVSGMVYVEGAFGNTESAAINADGSYSISVIDLEPPFLVYATGTVGGDSVKFYSSAVDAGSLNITPVTDFILRNALEGDETFLTDWATASAFINAAALEAAEAIVEAQLAPLLTAAGLTGDIDLMSISFDADHTGMDLVLDAVTIEVRGSDVTVTNNLTGESFTDDLTAPSIANALIVDTSGAITDAVAIAVIWGELTGVAATGADPTVWVTTRVAEDYLDEGRDKASRLDDFVNDPLEAGLSFTTYIIANTGAIGAHDDGYIIGVDMSFGGVIMDRMTTTMVVNTVTDPGWYWYGDQMMVGLWEAPMSYMSKSIDDRGGIMNDSGIQFYINDEFGYAFGNGVKYIVVNGPGVAGGGIVMKHDGFNAYKKPTGDMLMISLDAADVIGIGDNAEYNVRLCDNTAWPDNTLEGASGTSEASNLCTGPIAEYKTTNTKPPVAWDDPDFLDIFPVLVAPTSHDITTYNFASGVNVQWSNPTNGTYVVRASVMAGSDWAGNSDDNEFMPTDTSYTVDTSAFSPSPMWGNIMIEGYDIFDRKVSVGFDLQDPAPAKPGN